MGINASYVAKKENETGQDRNEIVLEEGKEYTVDPGDQLYLLKGMQPIDIEQVPCEKLSSELVENELEKSDQRKMSQSSQSSGQLEFKENENDSTTADLASQQQNVSSHSHSLPEMVNPSIKRDQRSNTIDALEQSKSKTLSRTTTKSKLLLKYSSFGRSSALAKFSSSQDSISLPVCPGMLFLPHLRYSKSHIQNQGFALVSTKVMHYTPTLQTLQRLRSQSIASVVGEKSSSLFTRPPPT